MTTRVRAVGAVIRDDRGRLLLIRRGRPPAKGRWTLPGGRLEPGESDSQGLLREVLEETGLRVSVTGFAGSVERPGPSGVVYAIYDYACDLLGGELRAGDDAEDARWFSNDEVRTLPTTDGLVEALTEWGLFD